MSNLCGSFLEQKKSEDTDQHNILMIINLLTFSWKDCTPACPLLSFLVSTTEITTTLPLDSFVVSPSTDN